MPMEIVRPGAARSETESGSITLDADQVKELRRALNIGLACFGQVHEVRSYWELQINCGESVPDGALPLHPTGCARVPTIFAEALSSLE